MKTTAQLVLEYNAAAEYLGIPLVKKFQDRKTAERRHSEIILRAEALQDQSEPAAPATGKEEVPAPQKAKTRRNKAANAPKTPVDQEEKTLPLLVTFMKAGVVKDQKPATILRTALETFSSATRVQFKHSAIAAGLNGLSARNMFDKVNKK